MQNTSIKALIFGIASAIFSIEGLADLYYSLINFNHGNLSWDSALYGQAWYLLGHLSIFPYSTVLGADFFGNHGELIMWLLALLSPFGNIFTLLIVQGLAIVVAQILVVDLIWHLLEMRSRRDLLPMHLVVVIFFFSLITLVLNPFVSLGVSVDFHLEPVFGLVNIAFIRSIFLRSRFQSLYFVLSIASGMVSVIWLISTIIGMCFLVRDRKNLIYYLIGCLVWIGILFVIGADKSQSLLDGYGYLSKGTNKNLIGIIMGFFTHGTLALKTIEKHYLDIFANFTPSSYFGFFDLFSFPVVVIVGLINLTSNYRGGVFSQPGFQWLIIYLIMPIGAANFLVSIYGRLRVVRKFAPSILMLSSLFFTGGYFYSFLPPYVKAFDQSPGDFAALTENAGAFLRGISSEIPSKDEVIAWQGVSGMFFDHRYLYAIRTPGIVNLNTDTIWFIIAPYSGIEIASPLQSLEALNVIAGLPKIKLVGENENIWVFRWQKPQAETILNLGGKTGAIWGSETAAGIRSLKGAAKNWSVDCSGKRGYVAYGVNSYLPSGTYTFSVFARNADGISLQVWDDSLNEEIGASDISSNTDSQYRVSFRVRALPESSLVKGKFIFRANFAAPPPGDLVELRIYNELNQACKLISFNLN